MNNTIPCPNCNKDNPFYASKCTNCNNFLRDKISNIDLWKTISGIIEVPFETFRGIIKSEHKNFISVLIIFASLKLFIDSIFISMYSGKEVNILNSFSIFVLIILGVIIAIVLIYSLIFKFTTAAFGAQTRFKDNLAIIIYAFIPHALALCILFPIELVVFGTQIFSTNPSPFVIKETLAYILAGIEILVAAWGIFLIVTAFYAQTKSLIFAFVSGIIFYGIIFYCLYLSAFIL